MGFNTTVVVLNDALHYIEEDKEFGANLSQAIKQLQWHQKHIYVGAGSCGSHHANAATVIETHHADSVAAVAVGLNYGKSLGYIGGYRFDSNTKEGKIEILRNLASNFGFKIAIKEK